MRRKGIERSWFFLWMWVICCLVLSLNCQHQKRSALEKTRVLPIKKAVFVGFLPAVTAKEESGVYRNPLSGSVVSAEPVSRDVVLKMNDILFDRVTAEKGYELVSRTQAMGVYSSIVASDQNVGMPAIKVIQEVGKTFNADAVLVGYIYRWREREGKDYAVDRAASVSFDLQLVRSFEGAILWKGKFDKTQHSLSENILDMGTFLESGGKWMTAEKLAMIGLRKMLEEMPSGSEE